jgi:hypothetical protein
LRVGFTGHQDLPSAHVGAIRRALRRELEQVSRDLVGISSLADGADQLFASTVLDLGGKIEVVIPSEGYEGTFSSDALDRYRNLLSRATSVICLTFPQPSEDAFYSAGRYVVDHCDRVIAVWDGKDAKGLGGTADIVSYARGLGTRVEVVWPEGATR